MSSPQDEEVAEATALLASQQLSSSHQSEASATSPLKHVIIVAHAEEDGAAPLQHQLREAAGLAGFASECETARLLVQRDSSSDACQAGMAGMAGMGPLLASVALSPHAEVAPAHAAPARTSSTASSASDSPLICRFCHDEESEVPNDRLIAPCLCMGSVKYVHVSCLAKWRAFSPTQAATCGSCQMAYRTRQVDTPIKSALRSRMLVPVLLLLLWVALAALLGFAPVALENTSFWAHMLNGEVLTGAIGLAVAGYELLSSRSANEILLGVHGRGCRLLRLTVWYLWRLYVLLCAGLILFLSAYPAFFKGVIALLCIGWLQLRVANLIWANLAQPKSEVLEIGDEERASLLAQRREEERRKQQERREQQREARERELSGQAAEGRPQQQEEEEDRLWADGDGDGEQRQPGHDALQQPQVVEQSLGEGQRDEQMHGRSPAMLQEHQSQEPLESIRPGPRAGEGARGDAPASVRQAGAEVLISAL